MEYLNIAKITFLTSLMFFVCSCAKERAYYQEEKKGQKNITFTPKMSDMTLHVITKSTPENDIYTLHLLLFDATGNIITQPLYLENKDKTPLLFPSGNAFSIPVIASTQGKYKNCTAYMIANIGQITSDGATFFNDVLTEDALAQKYASAPSTAYTSPNAILSTGIKTGIDLTVKAEIPITLTRAMACIRFNVNTSFTENYPHSPAFVLKNWEVRHIPSQTFITPHATADFADKNTASYSDFTSTGPSLTFYTWENRRGSRSGLVSGKNAQPDNCPEDMRQCYKPSYAPSNASYVLLHGVFTDHHGNAKNVTYTFYLGADNYKDYNILRNNRYTYNVTISGVTRSSVSVFVEGYDARVDVSFLNTTILEETRLDAHYDTRTAEITSGAGTIKAEILSSDGRNTNNSFWLKISPTPSPSYGAIPSSEYTSYSTPALVSSAVRLFILANENTSVNAREAILRITHTSNDGTNSIQNYTIRQKGLLKVGHLGVESFEEYSKIYDLRSPYNTSVVGLPWGYYGQREVYDLNGSALRENGLSNTRHLIDSEGSFSPFSGWEKNSLYKNYAARYCYNKNKRNADGTVAEYKWHLPSLEELNTITSAGAISSSEEGRINANDVFWSSSCPTRIEVSELNRNIPPFWQWLVNILIAIFGNNAEAANVAKASKAGAEFFATNSSGEITVRAYPTRNTVYHVRCVRYQD